MRNASAQAPAAPLAAAAAASAARDSPHSPVEPEGLRERLEAVLERCVADALLDADCQHAEDDQALVEQTMHPLAQRLREVDHHVATEHELELVESAVGDQVV